MLATQVLPESDFEVNVKNNSEPDVVGFLKAENKEHVIRKGENKIGRDPSVCSIVLENFTVSKVHAVIESDGIDETFIYDFGSTNQTKLGKKCLKPHCRYKIDDGAVITFGNVVAEFKAHNSIEYYKDDIDSTPPYSGEKNKSNLLDDGDDIFELATQVNFFEPSTSGEKRKSEKLEDESIIFKIPQPRNLGFEQSTSLESSQNCFDAETQCRLNEADFSAKEKFDDDTDSRIFNLSTQCQIIQPLSQKVSSNEEKFNDDLLNDGHDDILSSVSLNSPQEQSKNVLSGTTQNSESLNVKKEKQSKPQDLSEDEHDGVINIETHGNDEHEKSCLNDSYLDITLNDLETQNVDNVDMGNNEEPQLMETKDNKVSSVSNENIAQKEHSMVIQESSDDETQIYSPEFLGSNQRSEEDLINTQPYTSESYKNKTNFIKKEYVFEESKNSGLSENEIDEDFVSTQVFSEFNNTKEKEKQKSDLDDNGGNVGISKLPEGDEEDEDFLATQLFSGPVNNLEKTNRNTQNSTVLEGIEECEDFLATQLFSGPVNNFEKTKETQGCVAKNVGNSPVAEEMNESEDFLATQLFSPSVNYNKNKDTNKMKENEIVRESRNAHSVEIENENSEDFVATQVFLEPVNNCGQVKEKQSDVNSHGTEEDEDLLETQLFPDSGINSEKKEKQQKCFVSNFDGNNSTDKEGENREDFLCTQIFEPPPTSVNVFQTRESSPDLLCLNDRQECSQDFISTQLFGEEMVDVKPVVFKREKIGDEDKESIKKEKFSNSHVSDSSGDDTESDLEIITERICSIPGKQTSPQSSPNKVPGERKSTDGIQTEILDDNSNSSYVFELEESQTKSEMKTDKSIASTIQVEEHSSDSLMDTSESKKSKANTFWECLSLEMPSTQDVEKTLKKVHSESEAMQKSKNTNLRNEERQIVKINKRTWKSECETSEIPIKKSRSSNRNCDNEEKRLSKLWQNHDITDIRTSRTRRADKTPNSKDSSDSKRTPERKGRFIQARIEETPIVVREYKADSSKRSLSPNLESDFSSCRRVLRSSKFLRNESPYLEKNPTTPGSNQKNTPSRKVRKTSRRRSKWRVSGSCVSVIFTGFECELLDKIIKELKGKKSEVLSLSHAVVTDKVRRTVKFLCAIGLGLPIVSPEWLLNSKKENEFLNPWDFILEDELSEEKWNFNLKTSLERSKKSKLLKGMSVFATDSTKPPPQDLLAIVESCGGTPIVRRPDVWPKKTIIASCEEDEEQWPTHKISHVHIVHYECILSGVLRQKLDIKTFKLT